MNGGQDLGGMQGFGPIRPDPQEPLWHDDWEPRVLALTLAMGATGAWNIDQSRHARESLPPGQYLTSTYYRIWLEGMERLLLERGLVTREELADGVVRAPALPLPRRLTAEAVPRVVAAGTPADRPEPGPARFAPGDRVRAKTMHPSGHTRLPRYVRGRFGTVVAVHGAHVYPETHATRSGDPSPRWLYTVRFEARELWGEDTTAAVVHVDAWEPYLEPVVAESGR
ncbi:MAG: nitrile hydratase subunit beta [Burkholderiales bacterium]|nr:MAG: nitrile hydratase subunit beta [Burkholderiales bacterium]